MDKYFKAEFENLLHNVADVINSIDDAHQPVYLIGNTVILKVGANTYDAQVTQYDKHNKFFIGQIYSNNGGVGHAEYVLRANNSTLKPRNIPNTIAILSKWEIENLPHLQTP